MRRLDERLSMTSEHGITRRYAVLMALQEFAIWLPLPVLVLHMTDRGLDLALIGMAFAIRAVCVVLLEVPTGGLADAVGRKPIALASQAFTLVSMLFLLYVGGPLTLMLYALFQGVGAALHSGALEAWYVDALQRSGHEESLQKHLATVSVAQTAALLAGAALGGTLPALVSGWALPWPLAGFGIALLAGIALRVVVLWLTVVLVHEPRSAGRARPAGVWELGVIVRDGLRLVHRIPVMPYLLVAGAAMGVALVSVETLWQPIASLTFGAEPQGSAVFGLLGLVLGGAGLLGSLAVMRYGDGFPGGPVALAIVSQVVKGGAMLILAFQAGALGVSLGLGLAFFAIATQNVPHDALFNAAVPAARRSIMLSINSLVLFLGVAVGSASLGLLATRFDPRLALGVAALFTLVTAVAYVGVALAARRDSADATQRVVEDEPTAL